MVAWMIRATLVSGLAAVAASCFELALNNRRMATRFAWLFGIAVSLVVPFVPGIARAPAVSAMLPAIHLPNIQLSAAASTDAQSISLSVWLWLVLSVAAVCVYAIAYARLHAARRQWQSVLLDQRRVLVSERYGPAVCGFWRPRIVVPNWIFGLGADEQRLIVLHECEHIKARDHLLVLASIGATAIMPWNPFVWLQIRRLRFAIEADCDQRVLASRADPQKYASLLLDVGRRHSRLMLSPALAEQRHGLEKRISIMATSVLRHRWRALGLALVGVAVTIIACESRLPMDPIAPQAARSDAGPMKVRNAQNYVADAEYPALLRDAGIGGTVVLRLHVSDGGVSDEAEVTRSSGYRALDSAALRVVAKAEWANQGPNRHTDYWTTTSITFRPEQTTQGQEAAPRKKMTSEPSFTPYTVAPGLVNREEVTRALVQNYPPLLRAAGVGGQVLIWVLLDESGTVVKSQVRTGSGRPELDQAALRVADKMKFSPALNGTAPTPVWIQLPVVFRAE